jgi:sec-independent protein translocase protein TatA
MFGIGGGELVFIVFMILILFGSDKIPEIARTFGKVMHQVKHATNDIKHEIQKGAADNGLDINEISGGITREIEKVKEDITKSVPLNDITNPLQNIPNPLDDITNPVAKIAEQVDIEALQGPIKRQR